MASLSSFAALPIVAIALLAVQTWRRPESALLVEAFILWIGVAVGLVLAYGIGFTWSPLSVVGKTAAVAICAALPLAISLAAARLAQRFKLAPARKAGVVLAAGLGPAIAAPFIVLALVCAITGDCV